MISRHEAAKLCGVSINTFDRHIRAKVLTKQIGRRVVVDEESVRKWVGTQAAGNSKTIQEGQGVPLPFGSPTKASNTLSLPVRAILEKLEKEAARIYARAINGTEVRRPSLRTLATEPLAVTLARWLDSLEGNLDPKTLETYANIYVAKHWLGFYGSLEDMCNEREREAYRTARLKGALGTTVKKEVWAQDKFLRWCKKPAGIVTTLPPSLEWDDKEHRGTRTGPQRAKPVELDTEQVEAFLSALPEWFEVGARANVKTPFPIRDRFIVSYETGLRPETISEIVWRDLNLTKGLLVIRDEVDKVRYGRTVPLSTRALETFKRVREGYVSRGRSVDPKAPIFGQHRCYKPVKKIARAMGLDDLAPYDLRHARCTHLGDASAPLTGIGFLAGHKQATTTNRYLHGGRKAAQASLDATDSRRIGHLLLESDPKSRVTEGV